ncbi:MAG: FAD-dependent oxidoreductase [Anaerolineales bacterium]|nr:FAD-dependent oxidoreductase [Anaerolineales bacterium]
MPGNSYRVKVPDLSFYQESISCQNACPVRTDGRAYVNAITMGDYERAYLIARETNPFASTCGWVCGAPCEAACRRGVIDEPVAIRALKRFVNDRYGVYLGEDAESRRPPAWPGYAGRPGDLDLGNTRLPTGLGSLRSADRHRAKGKRVAVVGAGPAGLSCAHDLALLGYEVTIYEATDGAGGMLRLGVPAYRLPRALLEMEIEAILSLGPRIEYLKALGEDFSLKDLQREFDAIFLAIGTFHSRSLNIDGEQLDGVLRAVDFLLNVNKWGYNLDLGQRIVVIGGGSVAMDVARTAARLGHPAESGGDLELALDVARAARRLGTTQEVHCLVVEDRHEMLADSYEIEEAEAEGINIHNNVAPIRILGDGQHAVGVETLVVTQAFDDEGRFNPHLSPGTEHVWTCNSVIVAIGQIGDLDWVQSEDGLELTPRGTLQVDAETMATTAEGVFAGGDIAFGPRLIINAVADGQRAAAGIDAYLHPRRPRLRRRGFFTPIDRRAYSDKGPLRNYLRYQRQQPPSLPVDRRVGVSLVEIGYEEKAAQDQAARCLICTLNPIFDSELCILCNGCVDVCPMDSLKLVPAHKLEGDERMAVLLQEHKKQQPTTMLFDPTRCIRCGLCAARCPTEAIVMHSFHFREDLIYEDTV